MAENFETGGAVLGRRKANGVRLAGLGAMIGGLLMVVVAIVAWVGVSTQLRAENIVIPDDAPILAGQLVDGPIDAFVQAGVIDMHARDMASGQTYAELDRDDPLRATVMDASFLRASLFTSVIAFGVALMAGGVGLLFILVGWAIRVLVPSPPRSG